MRRASIPSAVRLDTTKEILPQLIPQHPITYFTPRVHVSTITRKLYLEADPNADWMIE